jgi:hypothetical protein
MSKLKPALYPASLTMEALQCAIAACGASRHYSDRQFANDCRREIKARLVGKCRAALSYETKAGPDTARNAQGEHA